MGVSAKPTCHFVTAKTAHRTKYIEWATHKFSIGEKVQFMGGQGVRFATAEVFEIVQSRT